jgi:DNA repair protein RecN (Recombination protein N)
MLKRLTIEQFVIIDRLTIDFKPGLTVLTGETGAGKSILLDAMGLVLGDPGNRDAIRQGSDTSVIEARLAPPRTNPVWKFLEENGLAVSGDEILIRRVSHRAGAEELTVNGKPVSLDVLKKAGTYLSEIHGQFANQSMIDPSNQMHLLDLSGNFPPEVFSNVANELKNLHQLRRDQEDEGAFFSRNMQLMSKMEEMVKKFQKAGMGEKDVAGLKAEYNRLLTAYESSEAFQGIIAHLIASNGAITALSAANLSLSRQKNLDQEKIANLSHYLSEALQNARAAVTETNNLAPEYNIDTRPLHMYRERMALLDKISEEVKVTVDELDGYYQELVAKLERARNSRERMAQLTQLIQKSEDDYRKYAHILSEHRIEAAKRLSADITAGLPPLKLNRAEFEVLVEEKPDGPWTEKGFDTVTFTARMNPGMPFSPISETASGGELARLVLALKVVLQKIQTIPTLVFDEIDTGIGGAAAAAVGERIAQLAETTQVMTITHSPQVAARGDQHLHVSKKSDGQTTTSVVTTLSLEERIQEISRMLAGDEITGESHAAAKKLIDEAAAAAKQRRASSEKVAAG